MDTMLDKNFNLIIFGFLIGYVFINKPSFLGKYNYIFSSYTFAFFSIAALYYRTSSNIESSLIVSIIYIFILLTIKNYKLDCQESFNDEDALKITLNNNEEIILEEGIYELDGENKIPKKLLNNINKINSFEVNKKYLAIITNKNSKQVYRGKKFIQSYNIFDEVSRIEIIKNN
jgi:hypothetical protein